MYIFEATYEAGEREFRETIEVNTTVYAMSKAAIWSVATSRAIEQMPPAEGIELVGLTLIAY